MTRSIVFGLAILAAVALTGCEVHMGPVNAIRGSGNVKTESRDVHGFDRVDLSGVGTLTITQGSTEALSIQAEDNLLPVLRSDVEGGTLVLGSREAIDATKPIRYDLTLKSLTSLLVSGAGQAEAPSLRSDQLELRVSGVGQVHVAQLTASSLTVDISGSGQVEAAGQAPKQTVTISGTGAYEGAGMSSQQATVNVSGSGHSAVKVSDHLSATISGTGQVTYSGSPTVDQHVSGVGRVVHSG
jgi:hypothetical protein